MIKRLALFAPAAAVGLSGCLALGSIDDRAMEINQGVGRAQNAAILLNVVRASRSEPLYFTAINKISGSGGGAVRLNLPAIAVGPDLSLLQRNFTFPTNSGDMSTSSSFDMNVLASKDFNAGLMTPLGLADVNLLLSQGYSRELVFRLVIDRIVVDAADEVLVLRNRPGDPSYTGFESYLSDAIERGLTVEVVTAGARNQTRLCYDRALMTSAARALMASAPARCGTGFSGPVNESGDRLEVTFRGRPQSIKVHTRSINGVFGALGEQVAVASPAVLRHEQPGAALINVSEGRGQECFTTVTYAGRRWCAPHAGAHVTTRVFSILNALVALKTSPGDLPVIPTVRITP